MLRPERLESHLNQNHVAFSLILHGPTHSAQVAASLMHYPGKEVAKTVALCAGEKVLLAVLPASYHVNFEKLSAIVGENIQLMDQQRCSEMFPDCEAGAIPPFGELYDVPVYLDVALAEDPEIVFGAGTLSESVRIGNCDFFVLREKAEEQPEAPGEEKAGEWTDDGNVKLLLSVVRLTSDARDAAEHEESDEDHWHAVTESNEAMRQFVKYH